MCYIKTNMILGARISIMVLDDVKNYVKTNINKTTLTCIIYLNINNVFNFIRKNDILHLFDNYNVPTKLKNMINFYLSNRKTRFHNDEYLEYSIGVPLKSRSGHI